MGQIEQPGSGERNTKVDGRNVGDTCWTEERKEKRERGESCEDLGEKDLDGTGGGEREKKGFF